MNIDFYKKIIVGILIVAILVPNVLFLPTKKAEAGGWPVFDSLGWIKTAYIAYKTNESWIKDYILDPAAWFLKNYILANITDSVINWINTGFEGSPTFIDNPDAFLSDMGNQATGFFINRLGAEGSLCGQFKPSVLFALQATRPSMARYNCTIENVVENYNGFMEDFNQGGWKGWMSLTTGSQNNPFGAYLSAVDDIESRKTKAQETAKTEVNWGGGFSPLKECSVSPASEENAISSGCATFCNEESQTEEELLACMDSCNSSNAGATGIKYSREELCEFAGGQMQVTTPGKLIGDKLSFSISAGDQTLIAADEISEALGAIANALLQQLVSTGLKSMTSSGSSSSSKNWYNSLDITQDRNNLLTQVNASIDIESEYIGVRQQEVNKLSDTISIKEETIVCKEKNGVDGNDSQITTLISHIKQFETSINTIGTDLLVAQRFLNDLNKIKSDTISASSMNGLTGPVSDYNAIVTSLHNTLNTTDAQTELDTFTTNYNDALSERNQCGNPVGIVPLSASAKELDFGIIDILGFFVKEIIITNQDTIGSFSITSISSPNMPFNITDNTCGNAVLTPAKTCSIKVKFSPLVAKTYYDSVLIFSGEGDRHIFLKGKGK